MWGPTLEVCSNDSYENLTNVPVEFLAGCQYCRKPLSRWNQHALLPRARHRPGGKETAILRAMEGNGGLYNVMAIISSIITTIKLKS